MQHSHNARVLIGIFLVVTGTGVIQAGAFVPLLSMQSDVVRCKMYFGGTLGPVVSVRLSCQYQTTRSTFLFFSVISSMLHPSPPSRPPAQENCRNIGMADDAGYFSVRSPARPGMDSKPLYHVLQSKLTFARGKNLCTEHKRKEKLLDDHSSIWRLIISSRVRRRVERHRRRRNHPT